MRQKEKGIPAESLFLFDALGGEKSTGTLSQFFAAIEAKLMAILHEIRMLRLIATTICFAVHHIATRRAKFNRRIGAPVVAVGTAFFRH